MAKPRILVVEDSTILRRLTCDMLLMYGYVVEDAADGDQALALMRANRPDLVLSDMNMRPLDGFGLMRAMHDDPQLATIPFVLMSGEQTPDMVTRALHAGIEGFLAKPFGRDQLIRQIAAVLTRRRVAA